MNEWFKKFFATIKEKWTKWTMLQKGIVAGIVVAVIAAIIVLISVSSKPSAVRLFNAPVDQSMGSDIVMFLQSNKVEATLTTDGYILVNDKSTRDKWSTIVYAEGYAVSDNPYDIWATDKWSIDDFQQNKVNWKQTIERQLRNKLEDLPGIRRANVMLNIPDDSYFTSTQKPLTASITLYAASGSDILANKTKVKHLQNLIRTAIGVNEITDDNICIFDGDSEEQVNDFEGLSAIEAVDIVKRQQREIARLETLYSDAIIEQLVGTYGRDRVNIARMKIDMDMSKQSVSKKEYSGITIKADNPDTPYDDSEILTNLVISSETVDKEYTSTGYNPEGPAGVEGQNPAVYSDASNLVGRSVEHGEKVNNALNETNSVLEIAPKIDRVTISVNIDGVHGKAMENGHYKIDPDTGAYVRTYTPISESDLQQVTEIVKQAVGYDASRGDAVTVTNIAFDHRAEFEAEDEAYRRSQNTKRTILFSLIGVAVVLIAFIMFRLISREIERKRRLREEELLRKQQAEREQALWDAKEQGMEVTMSVEERKRAELQENAIAMAKEHPEDVAMLIRTWLMEE